MMCHALRVSTHAAWCQNTHTLQNYMTRHGKHKTLCGNKAANTLRTASQPGTRHKCAQQQQDCAPAKLLASAI